MSAEAAGRYLRQLLTEAGPLRDRWLRHAKISDGSAELNVAAVASLLDQASALRRRAEQLEEALRGAREKLDSGADPGVGDFPAAAERARPPHLTAVAPPEEGAEPSGEEPPDVPPRREGPAGARLLATQMAVSGSSRDEIEARLREGFAIDDTKAILDAILGPEG